MEIKKSFKTDEFSSFLRLAELTYLFRLVCSLLRVCLHLVVGMVCDFGHWLFEDGCRLTNRQCCV